MKLDIRSHHADALTSIELLVVILVIAIFAGIFLSVPDRNQRRRAERIQCVNNLKQIGTATKIWAGDHDDKYPMQVSINSTNPGTMELLNSTNVFSHFAALSNELQTPKILVCPADERTSATNFTTDLNNSKLSYFLGIDADESNPQMFLAGDRNITNGFRLQNGILTLTPRQSVGWTTKIHNHAGNVLYTDGHAEQLTMNKLKDALRYTGVETNRLAIP